MTTSEIATAIVGAISVIGIVLAHRFVLVKGSVDLLREDLFEARRQLFLLAADGKLRFDSPQYGLVRNRLNGLLRNAHKLTFAALVMSHWVLRGRSEYQRSRLASELAHLDVTTADEVKAVMDRAVLALLMHYVRSSALFWAVLVFLLVWGIGRKLHGSTRSLVGAAVFRTGNVVERFVDEDEIHLAHC